MRSCKGPRNKVILLYEATTPGPHTPSRSPPQPRDVVYFQKKHSLEANYGLMVGSLTTASIL